MVLYIWASQGQHVARLHGVTRLCLEDLTSNQS
jgi:hypothetical protein